MPQNVKAKVQKMLFLFISQTQSQSKPCQVSTKLAWSSSIRAKHKKIGLWSLKPAAGILFVCKDASH